MFDIYVAHQRAWEWRKAVLLAADREDQPRLELLLLKAKRLAIDADVLRVWDEWMAKDSPKMAALAHQISDLAAGHSGRQVDM